MRVLALSPGSLEDQLDRLPALADICQKLNASLQVACDPQQAAPWKLLPCLEKLLPFSFEANPTLADWANLLGCVREPDFQICINFAEGQQVNLMLSMSHIPKRLAVEGFACTDQVSVGPGWTAQRLNPFLQALGLDLKADQFRLPLAAEALEEAREALPSGDGPLLLLSPSGQGNDWPAAEWHQLPETIKSRLPALRSMVLPAELSLPKRAGTQWSYWSGIREFEKKYHDYLQTQIGNPEGEEKPNKKYYDPRMSIRSAEESTAARLQQCFEDLQCVGVLGLGEAPEPSNVLGPRRGALPV